MPERSIYCAKASSFDSESITPQRTIYRAKWVVPDPWTILENGYVRTFDGVVEAVGTGTSPEGGTVLDLGPGALVAPLVNTHTHLELSALKGSLPLDSGFSNWVASLLRTRASFSKEALCEAATNAVRELSLSGCRVLAEISTLGITRDLLLASNLSGIFFHEYLGSKMPGMASPERSDLFHTSLSTHAPHTTAPALIRHIKRATSSRDLPMSVHLAESEEEYAFVTTGRGTWADFLTSRDIDFTDWPLPGKSPVQYLDALSVLDDKTLAVHLLWCSSEDTALLRKRDVKICLCPRSNYSLHQKLPDIVRFLSCGFKPCIGTDSLASTPSLSILDEMAFIRSEYESIPSAEILAMGTVYGAAALGMQNRFGRLAAGFEGPPVYVPVEAARPSDVIPAVVSAGDAKLI